MIPEKQWTLGIYYANCPVKKYMLSVNGIDQSEMPEAPTNDEDMPQFAKSKETKKYSESIRSVTNEFIMASFYLISIL